MRLRTRLERLERAADADSGRLRIAVHLVGCDVVTVDGEHMTLEEYEELHPGPPAFTVDLVRQHREHT